MALFIHLSSTMNLRFDALEAKLDSGLDRMDARFERMDARFDTLMGR